MSNPFAGEAIALRCACVMRGINKPFVVDFISKSEDAFGAVVPMPAEPVEGKVFVWATITVEKNIPKTPMKSFLIRRVLK